MKTLLLWWFLAGCGGAVECLGDPSGGDADADGLCDDVDPCPADALDDSDGDGSCDADDLCAGDDRAGDADADGQCDDLDPCPLDVAPHDSDGDGVCDSWDLCAGHDASGDADGDGTCDDSDPCFGTGADTDADGVCDDEDPCPTDVADDSDHDGSCDGADLCLGDDRAGDTDADGDCDDLDPCPFDVPPHDDDGDGVCDTWDFCDGHDASGDSDGDGSCDDSDPCFGTGADSDADGTCDDLDPCPADAGDDSDHDGSCDGVDLCLGDDRTGDTDADGVCDHLDPCPLDAPDHDDDDDGLCDTVDPCPDDPRNDSDLDGSCDAVDACLGDDRDGDDDNDGVCDGLDDCLGDDASGDADADGLCANLDPCFGTSDSDLDGDGLCDEQDLCPETPTLPAPCEPAPPALAHFWPGDGHPRDVVAGLDLELIGSGASVGEPGKVHRGFQVQVPVTSSLLLADEVFDGAEDFTFASWVRTGDTGYGLLSVAGPVSANAFLIFSQELVTEVHLTTSAGAVVRQVPAALNDLSWHHFAVTRSIDEGGGSSSMAAYLDGELVDAWSGPAQPVEAEQIFIGQEQDGGPVTFTVDGNQAMQGRVDEIAVFHRALPPSEVAALASPGGICEGSADTVRDGGDAPLCPITWYVDPDVAEPGDGRSFATAFQTLAEAGIAQSGDAVWVRATDLVSTSTVTPASDTTWVGGFAGHETDPSQREPGSRTTVLASDETFNVPTLLTLDGFAFEAQATDHRAVFGTGAVRVQGCTFTGFRAPISGSGGALSASSAALVDSTFDGNQAPSSGGAATATSWLYVADSSFVGNVALEGGAVSWSLRGAVARSAFVGNSASGRGGAVSAPSSTQRLQIRDSWFEGNGAGTQGGAVFGGGIVNVEGSTFVGNTANEGTAIRGASHGQVVHSRFHENTGAAALVHVTGLLEVVNSEFVDDSSASLLQSAGDCRVWSSTFTGNSNAGAYFGCAAEELHETVFIGNAPEAHEATCTSCCAPGGTVEAGTSTLERADLDGDALDEVYLPADSPCRDAGTVAESNAAPFLADFWWNLLTTTQDQALDDDPPDMGRHYVPVGAMP